MVVQQSFLMDLLKALEISVPAVNSSGICAISRNKAMRKTAFMFK